MLQATNRGCSVCFGFHFEGGNLTLTLPTYYFMLLHLHYIFQWLMVFLCLNNRLNVVGFVCLQRTICLSTLYVRKAAQYGHMDMIDVTHAHMYTSIARPKHDITVCMLQVQAHLFLRHQKKLHRFNESLY